MGANTAMSIIRRIATVITDEVNRQIEAEEHLDYVRERARNVKRIQREQQAKDATNND
jgi:hypothetical protein